MTEQTIDTVPGAPTSGVRDGLGAVQDVDESKREVLVDIPWEVLDTYRSDFAQDCFDEFLTQRLPAMCYHHDKKEPIGRAISWQKGARANQFVARFSDLDAVPRARQAFTQIKDGDITDFSFYFDQGRAIPHPSERSAVRFVKARMPEISPVTVGSIPGAVATGIRAAADAAGIAELVQAKVITEDEARQMLAGVWGRELPPLPARERVVAGTGARSTTVEIGDDGQVSVAGAPTDSATGTASEGTDVTDPTTLAQSIDAVLDHAADIIDDADLTTWPTDAQQVAALVTAAGVASDELLDALGIPDPDDTDDDTSTRSDDAEADEELLADLRAAAPYGDVEYADPGYQTDKQKRYPLDTEEHIRAALGYIGQEKNAAKYSAEDLKKVKAKIDAAAKKLGIDVASSRSTDGDLDVDLARAMATLAAQGVR